MLVGADWENSAQPWKVVEKGKWYREEGLDDREVRLTVWVADARTMRVPVYLFPVFALVPYEAGAGVATMETMLRYFCATEHLKHW